MFSQVCVKNSVQGGGALPLGPGDVLPPRQTPLRHTSPSGRHPPQADAPARADTSSGRLPPTATAADGTHPTGMHSCQSNF